MKVAVLKEITAGERRVPIVPETVKRLAAKQFEFSIQAGAGAQALFPDDDYRAAGASIGAGIKEADLVFKVQPPRLDEIAQLHEGSALISLLYPLTNLDLVSALAKRRITAISADMIPRTTLAQMMDVLSSQATLAGYRAVLLGASALPKLFPMLMTAAGTIPPAKILVLGAGVAGLQAIATARRLGAVVEAFDVRKVVKEQVLSLGAKFIEVDSSEDAQTQSGYAKELSAEYKQKQTELIAKRLAAVDVCITTALIPGQRAPILISEDQVRGMKPGSVIVDLAAEQGGNCALCEPGKDVVKHGVTIIGRLNLPSDLSTHASQMYSRNMEKFLLHLAPSGALKLDSKDEITRSSLITHNGEVVHERVAALVTAKGAG